MVAAGFAPIYDTLELVESPPPHRPRRVGRPPALAAAPAPRSCARGLLRPAGRGADPRPAPGGRAGSGGASPFPQPRPSRLPATAWEPLCYPLRDGERQDRSDRKPEALHVCLAVGGDATFASVFDALGLTSWRVDNAVDLVTKVPPEVWASSMSMRWSPSIPPGKSYRIPAAGTRWRRTSV